MFVRTLTIFFCFAFFVSPFATALGASFAFKERLATEDIREKYTDSTEGVKILIVPGHDDKYAGALYGDIREADLNLAVSKELYRLLNDEAEITATLLRTEKGYDADFSKYLIKNFKTILEFRESKQATMNKLREIGKVKEYSEVPHNRALPSVATILYGVNKYANDKNYDIVLHVHFNDHPGHGTRPGAYTGFAIYVPEKQYGNAKASTDLAKRIRDQLLLISAPSNLPKESAITEDQELIAIGAHNTLDAAVALIEYGYIYEPHFIDPNVAPAVFKEFARQTHRGVLSFLKDGSIDKETYPIFDTFTWRKNLSVGSSGLDVLALQHFLYKEGQYPSKSTLNVCQLHGQYNDCLKEAIRKFQKENKLKADGKFNEATRKRVNSEAN